MSNIVRVEKVVYGGAGLARSDNGVVFVPDTLPGELVRIEDDGLRGGVARGRLLEVLEPSSFRRTPECGYAEDCGGCDWLFMDYPAQLRCKREMFLDGLSRIGRIDKLPSPQVISDREYGYRLRAQIKVSSRGAGFYRRKTNDVVRIDRCPLLVEELNTLLGKLNSGSVHIDSDVKSIRALAGRSVATSPVIPGLSHQCTEIQVGEKRFLVNGDSFFQANRYLLEKLGTWALPHIYGDYCLDLYGGTGFFSVMLADRFKKGVLVENVASQVKRAEENFRINGTGNFKALLGDVEKGRGMESLVRKRRPDCIIVDPPRPGLGRRVRQWLSEVLPSKILYISCNPSTFSRDAQFLTRKCGYSIDQCVLFDLYPNTHHLESAVVFSRQ
ncbi:MAG: class I SAM-dependent RNA methyltransferase [Chitinispirillaceae bacterium]